MSVSDVGDPKVLKGMETFNHAFWGAVNLKNWSAFLLTITIRF